MLEILVNIWAWTFVCLALLNAYEGIENGEVWEWHIFIPSTILSLLPVIAQYILGVTLYKYGSWGVGYLHYHYKKWKSS